MTSDDKRQELLERMSPRQRPVRKATITLSAVSVIAGFVLGNLTSPLLTGLGERLSQLVFAAGDELVAEQVNLAQPFEVTRVDPVGNNRWATDEVIPVGPDHALLVQGDVPESFTPLDYRKDRFLFASASDKTVTIIGLELAQLTSTDALSGTGVEYGGTGGEDLTLQSFYLDLDTGEVEDRQGEPFFESQIVELDTDRRMLLDFNARTDLAKAYTWVLQLECVPEGGEPFTVFLDVDGMMYADVADIPLDSYFGLTGEAEYYEQVYLYGTDSVVRDPDTHVLPG